MKTTIKVTYNKQRVSSSGNATIYIRVTINRRKKEIPLDVRWPVNRFDEKAGVCKPRFANDKECEDNNIIMRREVNKCNEILRYYRLADVPITINRFYRDYKNNFSKSNFVEYMDAKIKTQHRDKEISGETFRKHTSVCKKLRTYDSEVLFADFDENWSAEYDKWLKKNIKPQKQKHSQNSRWSHHKVIKTYMKLAQKHQVKFDYPYEHFSLSPVKGSWTAIFESDVIRLYDYYSGCSDKKCPDNLKPIVRAFLFSCMTGLRISDLKRITADNVMENILVFVPYKTRSQNKLQKIPLNKMARKLFDDAVAFSVREQVFNHFAEQYGNRKMKDIAEELAINKDLHWHVARHTFISLYYSKTKDILATRQFAGHESVKQTLVYTHQNPDEIRERMKPMDDII